MMTQIHQWVNGKPVRIIQLLCVKMKADWCQWWVSWRMVQRNTFGQAVHACQSGWVRFTFDNT